MREANKIDDLQSFHTFEMYLKCGFKRQFQIKAFTVFCLYINHEYSRLKKEQIDSLHTFDA